jgi:hypothetical protein
MKTPTRQELMEFIDGTLSPEQHKQVDSLIKNSVTLQKEINLMMTLRKVVHTALVVSTPHNFTGKVMREILPVKQETFVYRALKNSSNIFAMAMVLSMIILVLMSSPNTSSGTSNPISQSFDSFSVLYTSAMEYSSNALKQYSAPLRETSKFPSGKIYFIGIGIFSLFVFFDGFLSKRFFHTRLKN